MIFTKQLLKLWYSDIFSLCTLPPTFKYSPLGTRSFKKWSKEDLRKLLNRSRSRPDYEYPRRTPDRMRSLSNDRYWTMNDGEVTTMIGIEEQWQWLFSWTEKDVRWRRINRLKSIEGIILGELRQIARMLPHEPFKWYFRGSKERKHGNPGSTMTHKQTPTKSLHCFVAY